MSPDQSESLLQAYRIPVPGGGLAHDVQEALALAEKIGYPLALKLAAHGVTHKTDVGGVALNISTTEDLRSEFHAMIQRAREQDPQIEVHGIYVQQMVKGPAELIVGAVRDPQFGPIVMAGRGGTQVELERDVAFELAPLTAKQARDLLGRTSAGRLLEGFRGGPPADMDAAVDVVLRLSQVATDYPQIQEIEVNPLIVMEQGKGAFAVDARVRVGAH